MKEIVASSPEVQKTLAIMQPTFAPWLGYFGLIAQVDDFVFLDDVQYSKQSWQSRNQVMGPNGPVLVSLPIERKPSFPLIRDAKIAKIDLAAEIIPRVRGCLGKAPYWGLVERLLVEGLAQSCYGLSALNIKMIVEISAILELPKRFHRASELGVPALQKSERLYAIAAHVGANTYLSPIGSAAYLKENNPFTEVGISIRFMNFIHPVYRQRNHHFVSHMSVLDALAWEGPEATRAMILNGIGSPRRIEELLMISPNEGPK